MPSHSQFVNSFPDPRPGRDPDNDKGYRRPRGWYYAKKALGVGSPAGGDGGYAGRALLAVEAFCRRHGGDVRDVLAAAVHTFLSMDRPDRIEAYFAYVRAMDDDRHPEDALPGSVAVAGREYAVRVVPWLWWQLRGRDYHVDHVRQCIDLHGLLSRADRHAALWQAVRESEAVVREQAARDGEWPSLHPSTPGLHGGHEPLLHRECAGWEDDFREAMTRAMGPGREASLGILWECGSYDDGLGCPFCGATFDETDGTDAEAARDEHLRTAHGWDGTDGGDAADGGEGVQP